MSLPKKTPFIISSMDSLGQGVSKLEDRVMFIPKTLPGEEGEAEILAQKKGVSFGRAMSLTKKSSDRIEPACAHFAVCPSCHYLHTDYATELEFKKKSLERLWGKMEIPPIDVIGAQERLHYRNRIQLHFDTKLRKIGMRSALTNEIVEIPRCLIAVPEIETELKKLYENESWMKEVPERSTTGHVELYWSQEKVKKTWNRPYAEGGFTQVFEEMNLKLKHELEAWAQMTPQGCVLDLFAGNGNLTQALGFKKRLCVDIYESPRDVMFFSQHLYAPDALKKVQGKLRQQGLNPDTIILDPPRSGLKDLSEWLKAFPVERVAYVSCDPHTLVRDLKAVSGYTIERVLLLDFFPSTFHYETVAFLTKVKVK